MKYIKLLSLGLLCLSVGSCRQDDWAVSDSQTGFYISLADADVQTETRSTPQELGKPTTDNFTLKIVNSASGKSIYDAGYTKDIIKASAGVYDVTTSFGDNAVLAFDAPYYEGKKEDIAIEEGDTASVTVECAVANALASVTFENSEKFKELYAEYWLEVAVENSSLKLNDGDKRSAYYRTDSRPTFTFKGVLKANGKSVEAELEDEKLSDPATFAAKAHCQLTLALKEMVPGIIPTIVKTEVDTVTVSETLPMEWLPAPKVIATDFGENRTLDVYETAPTEASIDFALSSPLQDIDFSVNFADENLQSLNGDYTLSALTYEQRLDFVNAGIDIPIIGEDEPSVRFSKTLTGALLATNEGVVNNTFTLKSVKANDRTNADGDLTYTIATHKPEFTVSVNANNCWSREFTVDEINVTKGNAETIKQNLIYQYYNGTEWVECTTRESVKGRTQQFNEAAENISEKTYKVRALYRGSIASTEAEATLETPTQLPNSDLDEWTDENYSKDYYCFYPWVDKGECHWDTNNLWTTRHRWSLSTNIAHYNGFHTVSYVPGRSGFAAELRSTGNGRGNIKFFNISVKDINKVAGKLFIGTAEAIKKGNDIDGSDEFVIHKDALFGTRPTSLKFWYKYKPYDNSEAWNVHMELLDENNVVISESDLSQSGQIDTWQEATLVLPYDNDKIYNKAKYIYLIFQSTSKEGDGMLYSTQTYTFYYNQCNDTKEFSDAIIGSILTIDDISLVYDK